MQLRTEIEIDASPEEVWAVLTDFDAYGEWNPLITTIWGPLEVGAKISLSVSQPGGRETRLHPTLLSVEKNVELRWRTRLLFGGLFEGEQYLRLQATADGKTKLLHGEDFKGLLAKRYSHLLPGTARGFAAMNQALKRRAETAVC